MCEAIEFVDAALPFPISSRIVVYRDDGNWGQFSAWFLRSDADLQDLYTITIDLRVDEDEDIDLTHDEWLEVAEKLTSDYPGCVFIYTSTTGD